MLDSVYPKVKIQSCIIYQIRNSIKYTKNRTIFPTDDSLRKSLYLATDLITVKWISPTPNWGVTLSSLEIAFSEELYQDFNI